jgi:acyl-CoA dehydrogenase
MPPERDIIERVRRFVAEVCLPAESRALAHDIPALDRTIAALRERARAAGVYAPQVAPSMGGLGLSWELCTAVFEEAGRSLLGPAALNCAPPDQPNIFLLDACATPAQRECYLLPLAAGDVRSCFAMTEPAPGVGSDPAMVRTSAVRGPSGWAINGRKWFASGARGAAFAIVVARTEQGITLFIVDAGTPGFRLVRDIATLDGFGIGGHAELSFEDCVIPHDAVLGEIGQGLRLIQQRLEPARLFHCMRYIGLASRAMELAQDYCAERESFGHRLAEQQLVQSMVADAHIDLFAARQMTAHVARRFADGHSIRHDSSMLKVFVSEAVNRVADRALQLTGALGVSEDTMISLIARELRPFRIYDGASEVHRAAIGRRAFHARLRP